MPSPGLQSFVGSWYSVVAYGAGGAGNTNDTTAIQAAMTAANANGGGTVVVPAGTYRLDSSLSWTGLTNVCLWLGTGASFTGVGTVTAASGTNNSIFDQRTSGGGGGGGGTVTSVTGTSPISVATGTTTPAITFDTSVALSQNNTITGTAVGASGLPGAASAVRIVGRNPSGTPASGTFAVGDVVINNDGTEYVCTVAGTPGTWVQIGATTLSYGTPSALTGTSASAGTATSVARSDHNHGAQIAQLSVNGSSASESININGSTNTNRLVALYASTVIKGYMGLGTDNNLNIQTTDTSEVRLISNNNASNAFRILASSMMHLPTYSNTVGTTYRPLNVDNTGLIGYASSLRESKRDIAALTDTLEWMNKLVPVTFRYRAKDEDGNYTDEADGGQQYGLIAEEVAEIKPDLCMYDIDDAGTLHLRGVSYDKFVAPLLCAIQQLSARIATLETRIASV